MGKEDEITKTVRSHLGRAREGKKLLAEGKSLSETQTPIEGPSGDSLLERREAYIANLDGLDEDKLEWILVNIEHQIKRREQTDEVGTSELHWMRIIVRGKLNL